MLRNASMLMGSSGIPEVGYTASSATCTATYSFGFNGKENDNEVHCAVGTFQDYGMRAYDPRLARFISVDPLASKYPYISPYEFASNHPIKSIDIDGLEVPEEDDYELFERWEELDKEELERSLKNDNEAEPIEPGRLGESWDAISRWSVEQLAKQRVMTQPMVERETKILREVRAEQVRTTPRTWETQNPGPNQTRTTEIEGARFRVNSGHGFDREHRTGDFKNTGLSRDQVEDGIVNDVMSNVPLSSIPNSPSIASPFRPYTGTVTVNGVQVGYTAVNVNGEINIGTYYPMPGQGNTTPQNATLGTP